MSNLHDAIMENPEYVQILREIHKKPHLTQRELAFNLGISLGKVNFLIRALIAKGLVKVQNFKKSNNKRAYLYYLTPQGIQTTISITCNFLKMKIKECEELEEELRRLKNEVNAEQ